MKKKKKVWILTVYGNEDLTLKKITSRLRTYISFYYLSPVVAQYFSRGSWCTYNNKDLGPLGIRYKVLGSDRK